MNTNFRKFNFRKTSDEFLVGFQQTVGDSYLNKYPACSSLPILLASFSFKTRQDLMATDFEV